jgi:hypothetical protein
LTGRRGAIAAELEGLGLDRTRLLNDNMELDSMVNLLQKEILRLQGLVQVAA